MDNCYLCGNESLHEVCNPCNRKITTDMTNQLRKELADKKANGDIFMGLDGHYHPEGYFLDINGRYYSPPEDFFPGTNVISYKHWRWLEDNTLINAPAGMLLVSQERWDSHSTEFKDLYQSVGTRRGLIGYGFVLSNILHLHLV